MKIKLLSNKRLLILSALALLYFALLWLTAGTISMMLWVVMTAFTLAAFKFDKKKTNKKGLLIVSSIIITFYLYFYLLHSFSSDFFNIFSFMRAIGLYQANVLLFAPFLLIYAYLMRDIWSWIDGRIRNYYMIIMVVMLAVTALYALNIAHCMGISSAEKGVSILDINFCKVLNMYHPANYDNKIGLVIAIMLMPIIGAFLFYSWICVLYFIKRVWRMK